MTLFRPQGIHTRLYMGFGVAVIVLLLVAGIGAYYESLYRAQSAQTRSALTQVMHEVERGAVVQAMRHVQEVRATAATAGRPVWVPVGVAVTTALLLVMFAGSIVHSIRRQLTALAQSLTTLGARRGDLTQKIPVLHNDDIGRVALAFNDMLEGLGGILQQVKSGALDVADASGQIRQATETQAGGVAQQSAVVSRVTQSVADLAHAVHTIAERAHTVSQATQRILGHLRDMQAKVLEMTRRVTFLDDKGESIGRITDIIDTFAEQTSLLALNASIEAAHAGEAGRGFAIVAAEIRKLSERSTESTHEIRDLIAEIRGETHIAAQWADESARQMARGLELVEDAVARVQEIAQTTTLQQHSVEQVVDAMHHIEEVTDKFLLSTKQTQIAAQRLDQQADTLSRTIRGFVVDPH